MVINTILRNAQQKICFLIIKSMICTLPQQSAKRAQQVGGNEQHAKIDVFAEQL